MHRNFGERALIKFMCAQQFRRVAKEIFLLIAFDGCILSIEKRLCATTSRAVGQKAAATPTRFGLCFVCASDRKERTWMTTQQVDGAHFYAVGHVTFCTYGLRACSEFHYRFASSSRGAWFEIIVRLAN